MKVRIDFVTNSSSSSFTVYKRNLTHRQIEEILDYKNVAETYGVMRANDNYSHWEVEDLGSAIVGDTNMNNFSMYDFLEAIGVNMSEVKWGD